MSITTYPLETIRHSAAHVLAQAVQTLFPDAGLGIGPAIKDGFYYDFELPRALTEEDLKIIEKEMKRIIKEKQIFTQYNLNRSETEKKLINSKQKLKIELVNDLDLNEYSFFENGPFIDLCRGPHVENTRQIGAIKLLRVSGAYWKGSEKNQMLQRIYGTAFHNKSELKDYITKLEEAKKRDHRLIGKELDLFSIQEEAGGGLISWHPNGARMRHIIETDWKESHFNEGYELLYTPHIGRGELWKTSGHLDFYKEGMYSSIDVDDQDYYIRPMNCPFHILVYKNSQHSYRNLPIRYAELGTVYRYERSGTLHGLFRVRGFTQDDAHIICAQNQMHDEILRVMNFCQKMLVKYGFNNIKTYISTKPEEKSVGSDEQWRSAEESLKTAVESLNIPFEIDHGGGAFYGPKIDIKIQDAIGREWQCSTIQFDFNLPERFDMSYIGQDGEKHRPLMIHRALLGSIERFFGILIEHYEGKFPMWISPQQFSIISVTDAVHEYCSEIKNQLTLAGFRAKTDLTAEKIGYKLRQAIKEKINYVIIIGNQEKEDKSVTIRKRGTRENLGTYSLSEFITTVCPTLE